MNTYRADLHMHTVLSPCGDLEMSPRNIINTALERKLDIIGITDHNTTRNCTIIQRIGETAGIKVLCGVEITTREEAHCLAFFETNETLTSFQSFLSERLPHIPNDTKFFGYQVVVNENDEIIDEEPWLLISALNASLEEIEKRVHQLGGLFIPAHVDKAKYSLTSQLGFVPPDLKAEALELSKFTTKEQFISQYPFLNHFTYIQSSDAHYPDNIGDTYTKFIMKSTDFDEIRKALSGENGRKVIIK